MNGINLALGRVIIHVAIKYVRRGGINLVLGEILIHILGVEVGNDISSVRWGGGGGEEGAL